MGTINVAEITIEVMNEIIATNYVYDSKSVYFLSSSRTEIR